MTHTRIGYSDIHMRAHSTHTTRAMCVSLCVTYGDAKLPIDRCCYVRDDSLMAATNTTREGNAMSATTTATYVAHQARCYTDETAAQLSERIGRVEAQLRTEQQENDRERRNVKIIAHIACMMGGLVLTFVMIHFAVSAYIAGGMAALPTMVQEVIDFARNL